MPMKFLKMASLLTVFSVGLVCAGADLRLIEAVRSGDAKAVRALLEKHVSLTESEPDGATALHEAARQDNLEIASLLIAAGAKVNVTTRYNVSPLALACSKGSAPML